jgi:hypothetical protein
MMHNQKNYKAPGNSCGNCLRGWVGLGTGLAAMWFLTFVALPQLQQLPGIKPAMQAIADSDISASTYWYTQSEETAYAALYVRKTIDGLERRR